MIEVVRPGPLATIQDRGRPGWGHLGVPKSGAADQRSLSLANRLVGNDAACAAIEFTLGSALLRFHERAAVALTGAETEARVNGRPAGHGQWLYISGGDTLELATPRHGLRTYLAVAGGIAVPKVLGSRSTDTLSTLGPAPLKAGDMVPVGQPDHEPHSFPDFTLAPAIGDELELRYTPGPRDDYFGSEGLDVLERSEWQMSVNSNRVGVRLIGPQIKAEREVSMPSEGIVLGSIEVPPDGAPIILLADHPPTGGYPVIGVIDRASIWCLAQARPGCTLRLVRSRAGHC